MSIVRDPLTDQSLPQPATGPHIHDLVIEDLVERKAFGVSKYGMALQAGNGRSMLLDAYQEVLDLAAYMRGLLEEERLASVGAESNSSSV